MHPIVETPRVGQFYRRFLSDRPPYKCIHLNMMTKKAILQGSDLVEVPFERIYDDIPPEGWDVARNEPPNCSYPIERERDFILSKNVDQDMIKAHKTILDKLAKERKETKARSLHRSDDPLGEKVSSRHAHRLKNTDDPSGLKDPLTESFKDKTSAGARDAGA